MSIWKFASIIAVTSILSAGPATASLIGDDVTCRVVRDFSGAASCDQSDATVMDPGVEFEWRLFFARWDVDISADSISVSYTANTGISGGNYAFGLGDLDWVNFPAGVIVGIENFSASGVAGFDEADISTFPHEVRFDMTSSTWTRGDSISFDLVTTDPAAQVPEPSTLFLMSFGLLGIASRLRKNGWS